MLTTLKLHCWDDDGCLTWCILTYLLAFGLWAACLLFILMSFLDLVLIQPSCNWSLNDTGSEHKKEIRWGGRGSSFILCRWDTPMYLLIAIRYRCCKVNTSIWARYSLFYVYHSSQYKGYQSNSTNRAME